MLVATRRRRGFVLVAVIFFAVLLFSSVAAFMRRSTVDAAIVRNRDAAARAEALARGGIQLAGALILQDRIDETERLAAETRFDAWAAVNDSPILTADGGELRLQVADSGARLNINALVDAEGTPTPNAEAFLVHFFEKVIDEMPGRPEEKLYDPDELARNLLDWVDADDVRQQGGLEDAYYQEQDPRYRAANRPLLSVEEIGLVEGFDRKLADALEPYLTVYPLAGSSGINPNTAPSWVLAALYFGSGSDFRLASRKKVRGILRGREGGDMFCAGGEDQACTWFDDVIGGQVYPEPSFQSDVFHVRAEGIYGDVRRRIDAVLDRGGENPPRILSWQLR
ncbi:MAG: type II secretion system minor pseudopilin GspK [Myxococcales bacterium]|nr:type II secretion system minor pseudopilin GspK [Myxococcales bacterium]